MKIKAFLIGGFLLYGGSTFANPQSVALLESIQAAEEEVMAEYNSGDADFDKPDQNSLCLQGILLLDDEWIVWINKKEICSELDRCAMISGRKVEVLSVKENSVQLRVGEKDFSLYLGWNYSF